MSRRVSTRAVFVVDEAGEIRYRWVADALPQQREWHAVQAALLVSP